MTTLSNNLPLQPEVLLAQTDWIRKLALQLVGEAARADDLAQEALLAAWSHPEALRGADEEHTRSWLARVLRNRAFSDFRGRARRRAREQAAARPERVPGAGELVERASLHGAVVAAVLRLEEPHREVLLMRYFEGGSTVAIAGVLDLTQEACRKRVSRALVRLRGELEDEFGEEGGEGGGYGSMLAILAAGPAKLGKGGLVGVGSVGASGVGSWLVGIAALFLALVVGLEFFGDTPLAGEGDANRLVPASELAAGGLAPKPAVGALPAARGARGAVMVAPALVVQLDVRAAGSSTAVAAEVSVAVPRTASELEVRVAGNLAQLGITGKATRWLELAKEERIPGDLAAPNRPPLQARAGTRIGSTDDAGILGLESLPAGDLIVSAEGFASTLVFHSQLVATALAEPNTGAPHLMIEMHPLRDQAVRVESRFGEPVEGAFVRVESVGPAVEAGASRPAFDSLAWYGPTDANGRLLIRGLPGATALIFTPLGEFVPIRAVRRTVEMEPELVTLSVEEIGRLTGRVVESGGGPKAGVVVSLWSLRTARQRSTSWTRTEAGGRFSFDAARTGSTRLKVDEMQFLTTDVLPGVLNDMGDVVVARLEPVEGELRSLGSGEPIAYALLEIYREGEYLQAGRTDEAGHFAFALGSGSYAMQVFLFTGTRFGEGGFVSLTVPSEDYDLDFDAPLGDLAFQLPEGMPGDTPVRVRLSAPRRESAALLDDVAGFFESQAVAGRAALPGLPAGRFDVEIGVGDFGVQLFAGVEIPRGGALDLGQLSLGGAELDGQVFDSNGKPAVGAEVTIVALPLGKNSGLRAVWRRAKTNDEGHYRLSLIDSRPWQVYANLHLSEVSPFVAIDPAPEDELVLDFRLAPAAWVEGHVRKAGELVAGALVQQSFGEIDQIPLSLGAPDEVATDANGFYRIGPLFPGLNALGVRDSIGWRSLQLEAGKTRTFDFELEREEAPEVHVAIDLGEAPFDEVLGVWGRVAGSASALAQPNVVGRPLGGGNVVLPDVEEDLVLFVTAEDRLWPRGGVSPSRFVVRVERGALQEGATLSIPAGIVEVPVDSTSSDMPSPRLLLHAMPGIEIDRRMPIALPSARAGDVVRYFGVPEGAELTLEGRDATGRSFEVHATYAGGDVLRLVPR